MVVQELLGEFPELLRELVGLLQMLDDGEVAVISGIENRHIRSKLKELFPLLGLSKVITSRFCVAALALCLTVDCAPHSSPNREGRLRSADRRKRAMRVC